MDESTIKIEPEERERIIANIKRYNNNRECFIGAAAAKAIQADYTDSDECWNKLIALIESAPAKKNMRATEFANKFEKAVDHTGSIYGGIAECLGYDGAKTFGRDDVKRLCDAIRNLDAPEDGFPWPADKDGVPIKPGDTVYMGEDKCEVAYIEYGTIGAGVRLLDSDSLLLRNPKELTHKKPRTLDDIIREMRNAFYEDELRIDLVQEAYEMGKAAGNEEASEV